MDVDVHFFAPHLEKQQGEGKAAGRDDVVVSAGDRMQQQTVTDQPPVDEGIDGISAYLLDLRVGYEPADLQCLVFGLGFRRAGSGDGLRAGNRAGRQRQLARGG